MLSIKKKKKKVGHSDNFCDRIGKKEDLCSSLANQSSQNAGVRLSESILRNKEEFDGENNQLQPLNSECILSAICGHIAMPTYMHTIHPPPPPTTKYKLP